MAVLRSGFESIVNTVTTGEQGSPIVTATADGRYLVTYIDHHLGPAQLHSRALGYAMPYGSDVLHNAALAPGALTGDIAATSLGNGNVALTWVDVSTGPGRIMLQLTNASGHALGGPVVVGAASAGEKFMPSVTELAGGNILVTWSTNASGSNNIKQQMFSSSGAAIGGESFVAGTVADENASVVAALKSGGYGVAYQSGGEIRYGMYGPNGEAPFFHFTANTTIAGGQYAPDMTVLANGNAVIAWGDDGGGGTDNTYSIRMRIVSPGGGAVSSELVVSGTENGIKGFPSVTALNDGRFVVVWKEGIWHGAPQVMGRVYNADGSVASEQFHIGAGSNSFLDHKIDVDSLADGRFVVTWARDGVGGADVVAQAFDARTAAVNLLGTALNDEWVGTQWADRMDGKAGADTMYGGLGNDIYFVDNAGDRPWEQANQGTDTVYSTVSFTLHPGMAIERLYAAPGAGPLTLTGNGEVNSIIGGAYGDTLNGGGGNDSLYGGEGNDTLNGDAGGDFMAGGNGNDTYIVDSTGDIVEEVTTDWGPGGPLPDPTGNDTVRSSISYTLGTNVENLVLTGVAAITGTGNALANTISGNSAANVLDGRAGADRMSGGAGDDTYIVDNAGDTVAESLKGAGGIDTVQSSVNFNLADTAHVGGAVENLMLTGKAVGGAGNALDNIIAGTIGNNALNGAAGNDTLFGGNGRDMLTGGLGYDRFVFTAIGESRASATARDVITDFDGKADRIDLSAIDARTAVLGNQAFGFIGTSAFSGIAGQLRYGQEGGATVVSGDVNGDRVADFQIELSGARALDAGDFIL